MNNEAVELSSRARRLAKAKGLHEHADDFAQDAYISLANGRKAQLRKLLIDFMREAFGDSRFPNSIKHKLEYHSDLPEAESEQGNAETALEWDYLLQLVAPKDRAPIILKYYWGMDQKEIGYALGISEGRVSQRINEIILKLRKSI